MIIIKKILIIGVILLAICVSLGAVSADDGFSFSWSSSDSSSSDGGDISFDNGKLKLQGIELTIPEGYEQNKSAEKLAEPATDIDDAKYSLCSFINGDKEIITKVFFLDNDKFTSLDPNDDGSSVKATMAGIDGIFFEDKYGDQTPTFEYLKDGKIVEVNAPDNETIESVIK